MNLYIKDTDGKPSLTATLLITGFIVCTIKLLVSGMEIASLKLGVFTGGDYSLALAGLSALYVARRLPDMNDKSGKPDA